MDRTTGRTLAKSTLTATGLFGAVYLSEPESFGGYNPIAVVHSKSLAMLQDARGDFAGPAEIYITIYLRRMRDATDADKDAIEASLDSLTRAAMRALWEAFYTAADNLQLGPSETGYPARELDSSTYRMERFAVRFDDDEEE
jgi:hypothetical protein